jgi:CheY-like chemotaxis protein
MQAVAPTTQPLKSSIQTDEIDSLIKEVMTSTNPTPQQKTKIKHRRILLVDDNLDWLSHLEKKHKSRGCSVDLETTLKGAKEKIMAAMEKGCEYDHIVTDLSLDTGLPGMLHWFDGLKLIKWCRQQGIDSEITLHSTAFREYRRGLTGYIISKVKSSAENHGAKVAPKKNITF